jgi:putative iron-regulated protein
MKAPLAVPALPGFVLGSALTSLALMLAGCGDDAQTPSQEHAVLTQYVEVVRASYDDSIQGAEELLQAVQALVEQPSQARLAAARSAWVAARPAYLQTEAYRFYEGPIDNAETGPEGRINAWPLDEAFIDYVLADAASGELMSVGIINDPEGFPDITREVLEEQNENGGEANISTGYHAIEFLLWGQDLDEDGPGARPFTDFVPSETGPGVDAERRGRYLELAAELLVSDLKSVRAGWDDGAAYTEQFLANRGHQSLKDIITGIAFLANDELAAERIQPAYEERDQEDEHSCFSDTTHQDMVNDVIGIQNVYFGRYGALDGPGLEDLVSETDAALDAEIKTELDAALTAVEAIPQPFDQAIRDDASLRKVKAAIDALVTLNGSLAKLTNTLVP